jgi:hypothetical protein
MRSPRPVMGGAAYRTRIARQRTRDISLIWASWRLFVPRMLEASEGGQFFLLAGLYSHRLSYCLMGQREFKSC